MRKLFDFTRIAFWIGLAIIIYMFAILTNETGKNYNLRAKTDELDNQITQLQSQIEELGYKVTYYQTSDYKEKVARDKLGLQKPGEQVVIVQKADTVALSAQPAQQVELKTKEEIEAEQPHWQQWRDFLFGS
jgi:cell division protein FtsB